MIELVRSNDVIFLSWLTMCLEEEGIEPAAFNERMAIGDGSIPAIKHRVMFDDGQVAWARSVLHEALDL